VPTSKGREGMGKKGGRCKEEGRGGERGGEEEGKGKGGRGMKFESAQ